MVLNKEELFIKCVDEIDRKVEKYQKEMDQIKESMDANDVQNGYDEENRGQLLGDFEKNAEYLDNAQQLKKDLSRIDKEHHTEKVAFGSIVETAENYYFIAAAVGEIVLDEGSTVYVISEDAPIFKAMKDKKVGESFTFNDVTQKIKSIN